MKRILCLAVVLLCLPVLALAQADDIKTIDLSTCVPNENGNVFIDSMIGPADRAIITGTLNGSIYLTVNQDMELTFRDVKIDHDASLDGDGGGALALSGSGNLTITFEGNNTLSSTNIGIYSVCTGSLTLKGDGTWLISGGDNDNNTIYNPYDGKVQFTLPKYGGQTPDGMRFKAWKVRMGVNDPGTEKNSGETITCTDSNIWIDPVFEDAAVPVVPTAGGSSTVPKTGDEANLLLWSALAGISAIGMAALAYKRKEA